MQLPTQRLILRSWRDSDRQPFAEMSEDADVMAHLRPLATRDACDAWIDFQISHQSAHGFCLWALESRASGIFTGSVGLLHVSFTAHFTPAVEAPRAAPAGADRPTQLPHPIGVMSKGSDYICARMRRSPAPMS
jgi:hypothetical protein